jgi:hypothetical protein
MAHSRLGITAETLKLSKTEENGRGMAGRI